MCIIYWMLIFCRSAWTGTWDCEHRSVVLKLWMWVKRPTVVSTSSNSAFDSSCLSCWRRGTLRCWWTGRFCWIWTTAARLMVQTVMEACKMGASSLPDMWVYWSVLYDIMYWCILYEIYLFIKTRVVVAVCLSIKLIAELFGCVLKLAHDFADKATWWFVMLMQYLDIFINL